MRFRPSFVIGSRATGAAGSIGVAGAGAASAIGAAG